MVPLYDAHNHFHDERLDRWRTDITSEVRRIGVRMVVNGTSEKDWSRVLDCASAYDWIIPSIGLHPWYVRERSPEWQKRLEGLLGSRKCGIGEIGLDRWIENPDVAGQEEVFRKQLEIAAHRNLPASIHCLKAWGRLNELLREQKLPACGFLLHSFGGPTEMVKGFLDLGAYFSVSGYFAHERKAKQQEAFRMMPPDRILIETDAPDMLPPKEFDSYGLPEVNHPGNIVNVYRFAAELYGMAEEKLRVQIEQNFKALFGTIIEDRTT
jgi:TatD DNase family protein